MYGRPQLRSESPDSGLLLNATSVLSISGLNTFASYPARRARSPVIVGASMKKLIKVDVFRSLAAPIVLTAFLYGCASGASSWTERATYHALVVASQYQEQLRVIVTRMAIPGLTPEEIEEGVAKPLERSVDRIAGVSKVKTQSSDASFVMEVHFKGVGEAELKDMQQLVTHFLHASSLTLEQPTVTVERPSPRRETPGCTAASLR